MVSGWDSKSFGELFDFSGGLSASRLQLSDVGFPYLHYGDIHSANRPFIDVCSDNNIPRLNVSLNEVSKEALLQDGDVVFVDASEDDKGASSYVVVRNIADQPFISGLHTIVAKAKTNELDKGFREYCFQSEDIKRQFRFFAVGTKVVGVSKSTVKKMVLSYPTEKTEQRFIAAALSDVDNYIAMFEKLIAKKSYIKEGAMQELLTGNRRLLGFDGKWTRKRIGKIGYSYSGLTGKQKKHFGHGNAKYISFLNVLLNTIVDVYKLEFVEVCEDERQNSVNIGDLFFNTSSETPEEVGMCAVLTQQIEDVYLNSFCFGFRVLDDDIDGLFLAYYFNSIVGRKVMTTLAQGATRYNLSKKHFNDTILTLPPKDEQVSIANILSEIDSEIDSLRVELKKMRDIKQGMMNELLAGRIRLV